MANLSEIYHFLSLSDNLLTAGQPTRAQLGLLPAEGVKMVINLALPNSKGALKDEDQLVTDLGMEYIHIPVVWENPTISDFNNFCAAMQANQDRKIFVHCIANMRVSAFVALYRMRYLDWDQESAFKDIYRIWDPFTNPIWAAFIQSVLEK